MSGNGRRHRDHPCHVSGSPVALTRSRIRRIRFGNAGPVMSGKGFVLRQSRPTMLPNQIRHRTLILQHQLCASWAHEPIPTNQGQRHIRRYHMHTTVGWKLIYCIAGLDSNPKHSNMCAIFGRRGDQVHPSEKSTIVSRSESQERFLAAASFHS